MQMSGDDVLKVMLLDGMGCPQAYLFSSSP